ncbi:MAG: hypothetical protein ACJ77N_00250 [Chloroflexota bacterium]|jgi:hypothetical protein
MTTASARGDVEIERRLQAVGGRKRVKAVLRTLAIDLVHPYAREYLSDRDRDKLSTMVREPIDAATDAAIDALAEGLASALDDADPRLLARVDVVRARATLGID